MTCRPRYAHASTTNIRRTPGFWEAIGRSDALLERHDAVLDSEAGEQGRGVDVPQRKPKRYLNNLDSIWSLQSFLLSEADRYDVPIITSGDRETVVLQITQQVNAELAKHFKGSPREVFGPVVDQLEENPDAKVWHEKIAILRG